MRAWEQRTATTTSSQSTGLRKGNGYCREYLCGGTCIMLARKRDAYAHARGSPARGCAGGLCRPASSPLRPCAPAALRRQASACSPVLVPSSRYCPASMRSVAPEGQRGGQNQAAVRTAARYPRAWQAPPLPVHAAARMPTVEQLLWQLQHHQLRVKGARTPPCVFACGRSRLRRH